MFLKMVDPNPTKRPSVDDIVNDPWMTSMPSPFAMERIKENIISKMDWEKSTDDSGEEVEVETYRSTHCKTQ